MRNIQAKKISMGIIQYLVILIMASLFLNANLINERTYGIITGLYGGALIFAYNTGVFDKEVI